MIQVFKEWIDFLYYLFEDENNRRSYSNYYLPKVEVKDYNAMTDAKNFLDQPINNDFKSHENIRKIDTGQGDD